MGPLLCTAHPPLFVGAGGPGLAVCSRLLRSHGSLLLACLATCALLGSTLLCHLSLASLTVRAGCLIGLPALHAGLPVGSLCTRCSLRWCHTGCLHPLAIGTSTRGTCIRAIASSLPRLCLPLYPRLALGCEA